MERQAHLERVRQDRSVNNRTNKQASQDKVFKPEHKSEQFMNIMLDGMDQAKFCLPRHKTLAGTSEMSKRWRPALHVTGAITWGLQEIYFLMPTSVPKDSNMNCTLLARCLDLAQRKLHPDRCLPDNLIVQVDNTTRESKNQHFGLFLSYLTGKVFKSIECHYLQVSHTKNELDQRFSTLSSLIKQADSIEDLSELQDYMSKNMTSALKRELIVEIIPNTWNFQTWFAQSGISISGLVSTHLEPHANHLWRFCRRSDIVSGQIDESDLKVAKKDDSDVVLTVKQWMSSVEPSQDPILVLPAETRARLDSAAGLSPMPPNAFSQQTLKEFRKTAELVAQEPWGLLRAQQYLQEMCDLNEAGEASGVPPKLDLIFKVTDAALEEGPIMADLVPASDDPAPRKIRVKPAPLKRVMRRPSASVQKRPAMAPQGERRPNMPLASRQDDNDSDEDAGLEPESAMMVADPSAEPDVGDVAAPAPAMEGQAEDTHSSTPLADLEAESAAPRRKPAAAAATRRPAVAGPAAPSRPGRERMHFGCSKCRYNKAGCPGRCRIWARNKSKDYGFDEEGNVVRYKPVEP